MFLKGSLGILTQFTSGKGKSNYERIIHQNMCILYSINALEKGRLSMLQKHHKSEIFIMIEKLVRKRKE